MEVVMWFFEVILMFPLIFSFQVWVWYYLSNNRHTRGCTGGVSSSNRFSVIVTLYGAYWSWDDTYERKRLRHRLVYIHYILSSEEFFNMIRAEDKHLSCKLWKKIFSVLAIGIKIFLPWFMWYSQNVSFLIIWLGAFL